MADLNRDNFLRWQGEFDTTAPSALAVDDAVSMLISAPYLDISPLANDSATYGIVNASLEILSQDNIVTPATWDAVTQKIRYYPPAGVVVGDIRELTYRWTDSIGTVSNTATIEIEILDRPWGWRGLASSYSCVTAMGDNTGYAEYATLQKYYTDDNTAYVPATTKANTFGDPDYIAPVLDPVSCPVPGATDDLEIWNILPDAFVDTIIDTVMITPSGGGIGIVFDCNLRNSDAQPVTVNFTPGTYDIQVNLIDVGAIRNVDVLDGAGGLESMPTTAATGAQAVNFVNISLVSGASITLY
jgi:hypothetical protein